MEDSPSDETWLDLEKLAALVYAELEPDSTVTHNATLSGRLSGGPRQIDVLIENAELESLVVVDCKDWNRRVNVVDVGAFTSLVEDVEATAGILICNKGFSKQARALAANKGISLCQLHDVESRKWQLDILIPIVWTQIQIADLSGGFRGRLVEGDSLATGVPPEIRINGRLVDPLQAFVEGWNRGDFILRKAGRWTAETPAELVTLEGNVRYVLVHINTRVATRTRLGYVTPQQSRGIFDVETEEYQTVQLNATETLLQYPDGGWREVGDESELAISPRGTVLTLDEVQGLSAQWTGLEGMQFLGD
jgi:Restriction endonuclease